MKKNLFAGVIASQVKSGWEKMSRSRQVRAIGDFIRSAIESVGAGDDLARKDPPRALRYELYEQRQVLSAAPFAPDGGDNGGGVQEDVAIPAWVDGNFQFGDPNQQFPFGKNNTFKLESNPSATKTIYLDFDGHHSVNNWWNHDIVFPAFDRDGNPNSFSDAELSEIQKQFIHVVEDFLPFDVNVTTKDPGVEALRKTGAGDDRWGVRSVNTQYTNGFGNGTGGIAHLNSFAANVDDPVFAFNKGVNAGGMTNSHEIGHALGLLHDGLGSQAYHPGTGSGPTGWGPIMGAPFGKNLVQWSKGEYDNATNFEDDLQIITKPQNGFGFRADDHGSDFGSATPLDVANGTDVSSWGIIERNTDLDFFSFSSGPGAISIQIDALANNASLDIEAKLFDAHGNLLATSNPANLLNASFNLTVGGGTYFISVDGIGKAGVYTDYGSLGYYEISGVVKDPVNDPPTLNPLDDIVLDEDAPEQTVFLRGITAGQNENQPLKVTATSTDTSLIPNPTVQYNSPDVSGVLKFTPVANRNGTATISVTVEDGGLDLDLSTKADNATITRTFQVIVNPINDLPTLNAIDDIVINEDAPEQTVNLSGISDGDEGLQPLKVTATSSNTGLIPNPVVNYTSPSAIGTLKFTPLADQFGTTTITVTVEDGGDDNDLSTTADNLMITRTFVVRVDPVNDKPTLDAIPNQTLGEDESRSLGLTGITAGGGETQPLKVTAISSNTGVMQNPVVVYTSDNTTGTIHLVPEPNASGSTIITVTVEDGGLDQDLTTTADNAIFTRVFSVDVNAVNDTPTLNALDDLDLLEDAGGQMVALTGISAGGDESQPLKVTATSSNTDLVSNQSVQYQSPDATGKLLFSTNPDRFGTTVITVTVEDGGLDGDLSTTADNATFSQSFTVTVDPVNDAPRFDVPMEVTADRSQGLREIRISNIDSGPFESQPLRFTVSTDNPSFLTNLQVHHTDPNRTGRITFDTLNQLGQGKIFVTLEDGGLDGNLATRGDNATTTKTIDVMVTTKKVSFAQTDRTLFGMVHGSFRDTYWKGKNSEQLTETGFGHGTRSRLDHRWKFNLPGTQVSMEFFVFASHDATNEQFNFQYKVDGTDTWKNLVTTSQNADRKYYARVVDQDLANGGTIWVRVRDTNRGPGDAELATLNVKKVFVLARGISEAPVGVNVFAYDRVAGEAGNKGQFRFQLADRTRLTSNMDIYYRVGGTATNGDYREIYSGVKTIKAGKLSARMFVTPINDRLLEGNESLTITVIPKSEYRITGSSTATVKILDDDRATYEAGGEVSYLGSHGENYIQANYADGQTERISEKLYGNRTLMNHQWHFRTSGEQTLMIQGKFDVVEDSFVDDFGISYSTDQQTWKSLGVLKFGKTLELNRTLMLPAGTNDVWVRIHDRFRRPHDTHVAQVDVEYLRLVKPNIGRPGGLLASGFESITGSSGSTRASASAFKLTGHQDADTGLNDTGLNDGRTDFVLPEFYDQNEERDADHVDSVFESWGTL